MRPALGTLTFDFANLLRHAVLEDPCSIAQRSQDDRGTPPGHKSFEARPNVNSETERASRPFLGSSMSPGLQMRAAAVGNTQRMTHPRVLHFLVDGGLLSLGAAYESGLLAQWPRQCKGTWWPS